MRALFLFLVIANLALFAVYQGYFGDLLPDGREPWRMAQQVAPERLRLVSADPDPGKPAPVARILACLEFGGFSGDDVKRVEGQLDALSLGARLSTRKADEQASYIVYLPPFKTKQDADRASAELRRIGVSDFFIIQDNGPFKLAISLGIFRSEDAAKAQLTSLTQQGVKNAKTGLRPATIAKTYYQIRNVEADLATRLNAIKQSYPNQDLHECPAGTGATTNPGGAALTNPAVAPPASSSSSGT